MTWTFENFTQITAILMSAGSEEWPRLCKLLDIKPGKFDFRMQSNYGEKPAVDSYHFEPCSRYDSTRNVVIVENPWPTIHSVLIQQHNHPILGEYIELNADLAMKILVLGVP